MYVRHPTNKNLRIHHGNTWEELPVTHRDTGLIVDYLEDIRSVLDNAINDYTRVMVIRCDLRFPDGHLTWQGSAITHFRHALESRLQADLARKARSGTRTHPCRIRLIWVREQDQSTQPHYHVVILLNRDAYFTLGRYKTAEALQALDERDSEGIRKNVSDRVRLAWASALGMDGPSALRLVHFPKNPVYSLDVNALDFDRAFGEVFHRLSYLAKADSKQYGEHLRHFGCSRF